MILEKPHFSGKWIADLLRAQIRQPSERRVGIEIERFALWPDLSPFQYSDQKHRSGQNRPGASTLLKTLSQKHHWPMIHNSQGQPLGLTASIGKVSLEPGSQVELSTDPFTDLVTIKNKVKIFEDSVAEITSPWGLSWIGLGVNPVNQVSDIELIPSTRYKIMDKFLSHRGNLGTSMMRRTSSVQINLDYTSEEEAIEMLRVSLLVAPVSYALFANSPFVNGQFSEYQSFRGRIWQETDPSRTGLLPECFDEGFSFDEYAQYLWREPLMFVQNEKTEYLPGEGYALTDIENGKLPGVTCSESNQLNAMRQLFSEARIKLGYVEVRSIDGLLPNDRYAAAAFWLGLLYSPTARRESFKLLGHLNEEERQQLFNLALKMGLKAQLGTVQIRSVAEALIDIAESELKTRGFGEESLLGPLKENLKANDNPATILLKKFKSEWHSDIQKAVEFTRQ
jgi:glutamate--cysteine ligase